MTLCNFRNTAAALSVAVVLLSVPARAMVPANACALVFIANDQQRLDALREILGRGQALGPTEALAIDALGATDVTRAIHVEVKRNLPAAAPLDFLAVTGYSLYGHTAARRMRALDKLKGKALTAHDLEALRYISVQDPRMGPRDVAKALLDSTLPFTPATSIFGVASLTPALAPSPLLEILGEMAQMTTAAMESGMATPGAAENLRGLVSRELLANGVASVPDPDSPLFVVNPGVQTKLNRFASYFGRTFPGARVVVDAELRDGKWPDAFDVRDNDMVIPVSLLRKPNSLPSSLLYWTYAFQSQRTPDFGQPGPFTGRFTMAGADGSHGDLSVSQSRRHALAELHGDLAAIRAGWTAMRLSLTAGEKQNPNDWAQAIQKRVAESVRRMAAVFETIQAVRTLALEPSAGASPKNNVAIQFGRAQLGRGGVATVTNSGALILELNVPELRLGSGDMRASFVSRLNNLDGALDKLYERYVVLAELLQEFLNTSDLRARQEILSRASFEDTDPRIEELARLLVDAI